ncbi:MAG: 4Fe-4S dicluster domain-containing protein [Candidatus Krumholzibacteriia bacterium]
MAVMANPRLVGELEHYGAQDVLKCYHCGNCSATCPFSKEPFLFPRKSMRFLQMGLEDKLRGNLEPWLCYYCGECSDQCPREAEPGETMMSMRRWLTAQYDFTGLSRLFYRSWRLEVAAILVVALLTGLGFWAWGSAHGDIRQYDGPRAFLPSSFVHVFDWIMAGVLGGLLLVNCGRMWWYTMGRQALRVPLSAYLRKAWLVPVHFLTQKRYRECGTKRPWAVHLVLMLSYLTMLVLIMFFLHQVQRGPAIDWRVHVFGYLASAGLLGTGIWALRGRLRRTETHYRHSHETDWIFLAMLLYVAATGVAQHVLHRAGQDHAANLLYLAHLMGVVPMLVLEVPFSKWAHLAYRPLAMYFSELQAEAITVRERAPRAVTGAQAV